MSRKYKICPYCEKKVSPFLKHIEKHHPTELSKQENLVLSLWEQGLSSRKIASYDNIIFGGGSSVRRVLQKHLTAEELELGRRRMIGSFVKNAHCTGQKINKPKTAAISQLIKKTDCRIPDLTDDKLSNSLLSISKKYHVKYDAKNNTCVSKNNTIVHIIQLKLVNQQYRKWLMSIEGSKCIFFEDEWNFKNSLCMSMLENKMGITQVKIGARKTICKPVPKNAAKIFLEQNHISGHTQASYFWGLYCHSELISVISFRKPFIKKYKNAIEIARFASKRNCIIVGGLSKLIKESEKNLEEYDYILTYADRRFGEGEAYKKIGFSLIGKTGQDYFYTDGNVRYNRFKFRARNKKTEKQIAIENGVHKVYGCGSVIYKKEITK